MTTKQTSNAPQTGANMVITAITSRDFFAGMLLMALNLMAPAVLADSLSIAQGSGLTRSSSVQTSSAGQIADGDWQYSLRPGEELQTLSTELLDSRHSLNDLLRHNNISDPSRFKAGNVLRIPIGWLQQTPEPARVLSVTGNAYHRSQHTTTLAPIAPGTTLNVGNTLLTESGQVTVQLANKSTLRISPRSSVVFNRLTRFGRTGMADTRMRLERGLVETRVTPFVDKGSRFEIETPSAVAAVRGTTFRLQTDQTGTRLEVQEGLVHFSNAQYAVDVPAGQRASFSDQRLDPPQQLPASPLFNAMPTMNKTLPIPVTWVAADGANDYLIDVRTAEDDALIQRFRTNQTGLSLDQLQNGTYQLELSSLDAQGWQSIATTAELTLEITALSAQPISPQDGFATEESRPTFQWQRQGNDELARVEIAQDPDFKNLIAASAWINKDDSQPARALPAGRYVWRVVTRAGGTSEATSPSRRITVQGVLAPVQIISSNQTRQQVRVFWQKNPAIDLYELQLSDTPEFARILRTEKIKNTTAALRMDQGKRYFIRLRGLVEEPLISRWGDAHEIILE